MQNESGIRMNFQSKIKHFRIYIQENIMLLFATKIEFNAVTECRE